MMAKSENSIGCCGHHLECQKLGKCVSDIDFKRCMLKERVIDYPFPTLYKLKELDLVEPETNKLTEKGIYTIKKYLDNVADPYLVLMILLFQNGGEPRKVKPELFRIKELLKNENL